METSPSPVLERIAQQIAIGQVEVLTTWDVVSETATLLRYRWTHAAAAKFLTRLVPEITILQPDEDDRIAAIRLFLRKRDLKLSLCDALSYVVVSTRLEWASLPQLRCGLSRNGIDRGAARLVLDRPGGLSNYSSFATCTVTSAVTRLCSRTGTLNF